MPDSLSRGLPLVRIAPSHMIDRQFAEWPGLRADIATARQRVPFDCEFQSHHHLLIAAEHSEREDGETSVEGLPKSTLHNLSGKLTFVPAGHRFWAWQQPRVLPRVDYFYIDPQGPLFAQAFDVARIELRPRLYFSDRELWQLTRKIKAEAVQGGSLSHYGEALGVLLGHELMRLNSVATPNAIHRGGLSASQQKRLADFIEAHLSESVRLTDMAELAGLSPFHFARAFKQSFGVPPHRYHTHRRIERAKALLSEQTATVTEIA
ncbi:MAG TPA: AraC family transcriptional regulator, partial [Pseudolabrys sp.]|nr:AraC family transcriptional regulator [Pseudolabrys sp.]